MIWNEILQWLFLGLLFWRVVKNERCLRTIISFFKMLNTLMQTIKEETDDGEQN